MSKLLVQLALLQTKTLVNAYTWTTLPLYAITQKPWLRLKLSKSLGVQSYLDSHGRTVYHRPTPLKDFTHPYLSMYSFNELVPLLDRSRKIVGIRDVLSEIPQLDPETGKPIKIDGRELKKVELTKDYQWLTVGQVLDQADSIARGLGELGVKAGDKVIIYADNGLEWFCTATALQRMNATGVSLLSILNDEGIVYGINQCEARFAITSQDLLKKIDRNSDKINNPLNMVYIRNKLAPNDPKLDESIANLTAKGYKISSYDEVQEIGAKVPVYNFPIPNPGDVAYIMYTSGTTGNPKGVMLTHKNLFNGLHLMMRQDREMSAPLLNARYAAYLPMAHIFGLMMNFGLFVSDARIGLCSPMTMLDSSPAHVEGQVGDIKLIKPELIGGVPLVLDRILKEIYRKLHARSPIAAPIFTYLMDYKIRWKGRGFDTPILNRILCSKINEQFGGRLTTMMVGSAPLNERTQAMVQEILNVKMIQAYGSTEMTGASHMTTTDSLDYGHCGVPVAGSKFYLKDWPEGCYSASDKPNPRGEIVVGGNTIADGYYKMPEETDEAFKVDADGMRWFESGDIGELLPSGNLKIIDRKKDLTKLANGEYVSLGKIESGLRSSTFVENICICTDPYSNHVTALITPNRRALQEYSAAIGKHLSFEQLCDDPEVIEHVHHSLKHRGQGLGFSKKELPVVITLVKEEWTPDNNLLTAALKMRRKQVNDFYRKEIEQMFERDNEN